MKHFSAFLSWLLFIALCVSLAYWWLQWFAPEPRPLATQPIAQRPMPPISAALNLFGGNPQAGALAIQLRGIVHAGRASESVAIIAVEGKPPRALRANSEVTPGIQLKAIRTRAVILSGPAGEREVRLPEFSTLPSIMADGAGAGAAVTGVASEALWQPQPQVPPQASPQPPPGVPPGAQGPFASGAASTGSGAEGAEPKVGAPGTRRETP